MIEIKMIAGVFLTIGITGAVISLVDGSLLGVGVFCLVATVATYGITKK